MLRFYLAMATYVVLMLLAAFTLDGAFRWATIVFLAGLALKTWLVVLRRNQE